MILAFLIVAATVLSLDGETVTRKAYGFHICLKFISRKVFSVGVRLV